MMTDRLTFCAVARRKGVLVLCVALCMLALGSAHKPIFTTFDAPGAGTGSGQGTIPGSNNSVGAITGWFIDPSGVNHGFLRAPDGTITTFDAPGAGAGPGQGTLTFTNNPVGAVAGIYIIGAGLPGFFGTSGVSHGFLRAPDGTITTFDVPGAGTGSGQGTVAFAPNPAGAIAGYNIDASTVAHGFLRARDGTITAFDAPGRLSPVLAWKVRRGQIGRAHV